VSRMWVQSIALALYFAARGRGSVVVDHAREPHTSEARVLLSGLGADEQLGGYSRHRQAYARSGWEGLVRELQLDVDRIGSRNLGRDDRVVSSHGKEVRYPFLAGRVVDALARTRVHLKCDPRLVEGVGDKILLRMVARDLGLERAASLKKRAIQFGARSAKMEVESGRAKGHETL
jgi:asparagine synthetase B (glutamine-hydrolysing)